MNLLLKKSHIIIFRKSFQLHVLGDISLLKHKHFIPPICTNNLMALVKDKISTCFKLNTQGGVKFISRHIFLTYYLAWRENSERQSQDVTRLKPARYVTPPPHNPSDSKEHHAEWKVPWIFFFFQPHVHPSPHRLHLTVWRQRGMPFPATVVPTWYLARLVTVIHLHS